MPIYEYACQQCQHEFEVLLRGAETADCPECESDRLCLACRQHIASSRSRRGLLNYPLQAVDCRNAGVVAVRVVEETGVAAKKRKTA